MIDSGASRRPGFVRFPSNLTGTRPLSSPAMSTDTPATPDDDAVPEADRPDAAAQAEELPGTPRPESEQPSQTPSSSPVPVDDLPDGPSSTTEAVDVPATDENNPVNSVPTESDDGGTESGQTAPLVESAETDDDATAGQATLNIPESVQGQRRGPDGGGTGRGGTPPRPTPSRRWGRRRPARTTPRRWA